MHFPVTIMENERSLGDLFKQAKSDQEELDLLDPRSEDFKDLLTSCIDVLSRCSQLVDQLALFSPNEEIEDVSTSNIQFLAIPYTQAELGMRAYSMSNRRGQLQQASSQLEDFLNSMNDYDLLNAADKKLFDSYKESRVNFRIVGDNAGMEAKRNTKIKRFQEERQLKSQLKVLREQSQSLNVDDEVIRKLYIAELNLFVHQTFQSLDSITQELQVLSTMPQQAGSNSVTQGASDQRDRRNGTHNGQAYSERLDPSNLIDSARPHRGILDSSGRPLQPFTITSKRTDVRKGVFRPGHSLPTMSIDEYLEEEKRRGGIIEGGGPQSEQVVQPDEDDMAAQDAATMKAREWDEFVEANPKGAGNTMNRG